MSNWSVIVNNLIPHGYCLSWQPHLLWLHGVSDVLTAISYYSIPVMLLVFVRRRQDLQFSWIFVLFGVFIMACGATHVMSLWTLWRPDYLAAGIVKAVTAAASVATAILLFPLIPKALALPGPAQWAAVHRKLSDEVAERSEAEAEVRRLNAALEQRVAARTAELEAANASLAAANQELRASEARMGESQQLLRAIIDNSTAVIFVKDLEGRYLMINRRYAELFHVGQDEIVGKTDYDVFPPERADAFQAADRQVLVAGKAIQSEEIAPQDDGLHTYLAVKFPLLGSGSFYAVCGIATDITERKQAEAERQARQAAEAASQAKSDFLSAMSHELRTPLNAILGYAQILRRDEGLSERQTTGLATIAQSGQHLLMLINDLLDLAKIEAGKFDLAPAAMDLPAFLPVVADIIRVKAEEKSLLFAYEAPADLPQSVLADEKRLRQVLLNLLGNAVKFTDRGQISLKVRMLDHNQGVARLRFEIVDSGIGMAAEHLDTIFLPFEQVGEAQRRSNGTGLGLAISRQLVRLMGSDIQVASTPGAGSRFWFDLALPLAEVAPEAASTRMASGYAGARRKLLIADDVVGNRALLVDLLGGLGFDLCEAINGAEAVAQVRAQRPDLVLMDLVMPVMDGMEAIRRIRAMTGLESLPVIAVSASADDAERAASLTAGADAFLPKPFEQERLLESIGALLGLTWTHAEPSATATIGAAAARVVPPQTEIAALHQLALAGDMRAIRRHADRLAALDPRYAPFADTLRRMAQAYQSKIMLDFVAGCLLKEQAS